MHDAVDIETTCTICGAVTDHRIGYLDMHCSNCKTYYDPFELNQIVEKRRKYLGLTRKEMAEKAGVKPATIRKYENYWPSKQYWELIKTL